MNFRMYKKNVFYLFILIFIFPLKGFSFTDQTTSERILRENKHFIEFINVCITNFAEDKKSEFMKVYEKHFNADVAYLQSDYKRAYARLYASQGIMVKIYNYLLKDLYLENSKDILDAIAPDIIRSKNARARLYLTLGYRDRTVSWTHYTIGEASNPRLYSYKLYKFEEGIKMARRAKRYGFLALFESQKAERKRSIYEYMLKQEKDRGNRFFNRFLGLSEEAYYNELGVTYEDYEKKISGSGNAESGVFEKKVERRVRFRNEYRTAKFLLNTEFDRAEDIIRKYVDDFNFKLIAATFEVLSDKKKNRPGESVNYNEFRVHLMDNYLRLTRDSVLESLIDRVKVEDDINEKSVEDRVIKKGDSAIRPGTGKDNRDTSKDSSKNTGGNE